MTAIRNPREFLDGVGVNPETDEACQSDGGCPPATISFSKPWRDTEHEAKKNALFQYARQNYSGVYIRQAVNDVFNGPDESDYRLARRFYERYPDIFKTYSMGSQQWVEPRIDLYDGLNLRQQSKNRKTTRGQGDSETTDLDSDGDPDFAKDRAQAYLDNYLQVQSDSVKESLYRSMVDDIEGTEDLWQLLENRVTDEYCALPYNTRHNNGGKAGKVRDRFENALTAATDCHNNAVVATLTTDPKQHSGLFDALDSLSKNRNRLLSWLATEYQLGYRPEYVSVLEFTDSGLPHLHLVLFGVSWAVSQDQLAAKWGDYGQGWVVDLRTAKNQHDTDTWRLHDDGGIVSLRQYIGKSIRGLQEVANSNAEDLGDRLAAGDLSLWKQSLYWATEQQYMTCSTGLKPTDSGDSGDSLPEITEWEFIGVRQYDEIPATVKQKCTFATKSRPPPRDRPGPGTEVGTGTA